MSSGTRISAGTWSALPVIVYFASSGRAEAILGALKTWMAAHDAAIMAVQMVALGMTTPVKLRLMRLALFWHMLDVVWIGIFTFVYLFGVVS